MQVAIVIPFRDRHHHLPILLKHLIPFLQSQYLEFGIFVTEQVRFCVGGGGGGEGAWGSKALPLLPPPRPKEELAKIDHFW